MDKTTFELLFRIEFKGLCLFALKFTKDYETAKEIVQDAFISLWEKRDTIDLSKPVKSYLTTIINNKSLNYLRDNKKFDREILDFENINSTANHQTSDKLVASEIEQQIKTAIDELPEKCREVFLLSRYENLKYQEIANQLNISIKTVETQMSKALQHMRVRLAEYLPAIIIYLFLNNKIF
ncbi:MAG: RNA polymerase sigma-70 factor [Bacteroidetes bacterium]|nr:RNA polymerase sigma-70 factor [Bacteroidota bacterium]